MKNLKTKLSISMILISIAIIFVVFLLIDIYEEKYVLSEVDDALLNEASYFDNYKDFSNAKEKEESIFDINIILIDENDIQVVKDSKHFVDHEYNLFKRIYQDGDMIENEILKIDAGNSSYVSVLIRVEDKQILDELKNVVNYYPTSFKGDQALLVLYVDISGYSTILNRIKIAFLILLVLSVILSGLIGAYFGHTIQSSQKKISHFFQNASHEMKTPLTSIRGYAEGMQKGLVNDKEAALDIIVKQSDTMQKLIDEILTISKLDSNEYTFNKQDVDVISIVEDSVEKYHDMEDKKHFEVHLELDEDHFIVLGDEIQIYKAINTIIDNAFKFAVSTVKISTYVDSTFLNIDIFNDGSAISKQDFSHIFDRFYSGDSISTGIGLAMAKEIMIASGGSINAFNTDNGVLFRLKFIRN